jgi:hypothetical protein
MNASKGFESKKLAHCEMQTTEEWPEYEPSPLENNSFQRPHFSHIMLYARMIEHPISAICRLVENSVQAGASQVLVDLKPTTGTSE